MKIMFDFSSFLKKNINLSKNEILILKISIKFFTI